MHAEFALADESLDVVLGAGDEHDHLGSSQSLVIFVELFTQSSTYRRPIPMRRLRPLNPRQPPILSKTKPISPTYRIPRKPRILPLPLGRILKNLPIPLQHIPRQLPFFNLVLRQPRIVIQIHHPVDRILGVVALAEFMQSASPYRRTRLGDSYTVSPRSIHLKHRQKDLRAQPRRSLLQRVDPNPVHALERTVPDPVLGVIMAKAVVHLPRSPPGITWAQPLDKLAADLANRAQARC